MTTQKKHFRIDFFHLTCANGSFESFVSPATKRRFYRKSLLRNPYQIILDVFEDSPGYICGNFIKVKMNDIDPKYNVTTYTTSSLDLNEDEGIPTGNVFLYLKRKNILFFQIAKSGISTAQFCEYFETYCDTGTIKLNYVLSEEGFRKLSDFSYISKIEVGIKGLDSGYALNQSGNSVRGVLQKFKELKANNVKIEISKGYRGEGLLSNAVKHFAREIYSIMKSETSEEDGQYIQITGRQSDEDELTAIDLLITPYRRWLEVEISSDSRLNSELHTKNKITGLKELITSVGRDLR